MQLLTQLKDFKLVTTLVLVFKKIESENKTKYDNFYSSSKEEMIINGSGIDDTFQPIYTIIITNIRKSLWKGSGWIIDSVINNTISISNYNPLVGSSYIKLAKELDHPRKSWLIFKILIIINALNCVYSDTKSCRPYSKENHESW